MTVYKDLCRLHSNYIITDLDLSLSVLINFRLALKFARRFTSLGTFFVSYITLYLPTFLQPIVVHS